ncbi:hypothetical protein NKH70_23975 [Mesorhizobium sp. M0991]
MALEDRREILAEMIPDGGRIQFSQALPGEAKAIFPPDRPGGARRHGVEAQAQQIPERQLRLADGLTHDLTTDLASFPGLVLETIAMIHPELSKLRAPGVRVHVMSALQKI